MAKGVARNDLIKFVVETINSQQAGRKRPNPKWYISSKHWRPSWLEWLKKLPPTDVQLFVVPHVAADQATEVYDDPNSSAPLSRWLTKDGAVTAEAMTRIDRLARDFPKASVVILPSGLSVIGLFHQDGGKRLFRQTSKGKGFWVDSVPMDTIFLPAMATLELEHDSESSANCKLALRFTATWMQREAKRITDPSGWRPHKDQHLDWSNVTATGRQAGTDRDAEGRDRDPLNPEWQRPVDWSEAQTEWQQAYQERGVITGVQAGVEATEAVKRSIEIKRSMVEVDGYVCLLPQKRRILRQITKVLRAFDRDQGSRSFMLVASPGAGKSYLVSKLAELHEFSLLQFNITSLLSREDLLDCFDTIVTSQAANPRKRFLVFFDEVDAVLNQQSVYDAFLRPLEEGLYVRAGKSFHLNPCVWFFAGTRIPTPSVAEIHPGSRLSDRQTRLAEVTLNSNHDCGPQKGSDFVSRLTEAPADFDFEDVKDNDFDSEIATLARLENVYAGVTLLKIAFPDVLEVTEAVLEAFRVLPPKTGIRRIRRFVDGFDQVSYGRVGKGNLPENWIEDMGVQAVGCARWVREAVELDRNSVSIDLGAGDR